jgi:hypothetical protein
MPTLKNRSDGSRPICLSQALHGIAMNFRSESFVHGLPVTVVMPAPLSLPPSRHRSFLPLAGYRARPGPRPFEPASTRGSSSTSDPRSGNARSGRRPARRLRTGSGGSATQGCPEASRRSRSAGCARHPKARAKSTRTSSASSNLQVRSRYRPLSAPSACRGQGQVRGRRARRRSSPFSSFTQRRTRSRW